MPSKSAVVTRFSNILYHSPLDLPLTGKDYEFVSANALRFVTLTSDISKIVPTNSGSFQRHFNIHLDDGSVHRFNYREAVDQLYA